MMMMIWYWRWMMIMKIYTDRLTVIFGRDKKDD